MINTYLSFIICGDLYAVNVNKVLEVLQKEQITKVPNAPDYIKGIINFRGDVVPVFETRTRFNMPLRNENDAYNIIVLDVSEGNDMFRLGAMVDKVKDVITFEDSEIKAVPTMSKEFNTAFLSGIYRLKEDFVMLLNVEKVFTSDELSAIQQTKE